MRQAVERTHTSGQFVMSDMVQAIHVIGALT